jgi:uncharacterized protein YllA (UPF0747 family)
MPTSIDFLKARVMSQINTLSSKPEREKEKYIARQIAEEFNSIVEEIKKVSPDAAGHLPKPITWIGPAARNMQVADIRLLELEMLLNQVLAILEVVQDGR